MLKLTLLLLSVLSTQVIANDIRNSDLYNFLKELRGRYSSEGSLFQQGQEIEFDREGTWQRSSAYNNAFSYEYTTRYENNMTSNDYIRFSVEEISENNFGLQVYLPALQMMASITQKQLTRYPKVLKLQWFWRNYVTLNNHMTTFELKQLRNGDIKYQVANFINGIQITSEDSLAEKW